MLVYLWCLWIAASLKLLAMTKLAKIGSTTIDQLRTLDP